KRPGYFLFPNPVRREVLVLGKIAASLLVCTAVLSMYYGAAAIAALVITGSLTWDVGLSYVYTLGYMTAVVGVAYLLSALLKGTVAATVLTFFLFTLIFAIVGGILPRANVEPWFIPTSASGIIANALGGAAVRPGPGGGDVGFVSDHPRGQGVPAEPPQGDRAALPRLRIRGRSGTGRSVPRVPCDLEAPKDKHERGDPEPGGRAPPDRGRDAREGPADSVEVMAGKIHDR